MEIVLEISYLLFPMIFAALRGFLAAVTSLQIPVR
jgi:hypothetical protein